MPVARWGTGTACQGAGKVRKTAICGRGWTSLPLLLCFLGFWTERDTKMKNDRVTLDQATAIPIKWYVFYVSIYIGSAMITSHSLVNVISLSLSSWSSPYDIPPGQFPVLRPYYHHLKLQRHAEPQIWFQIRKISVHPEGRMHQCQRISFIWEVLKAAIRMGDKVNLVIYFYNSCLCIGKRDNREWEGGAEDRWRKALLWISHQDFIIWSM